MVRRPGDEGNCRQGKPASCQRAGEEKARDRMTHAIRVHEHGGPEVLEWERIEVGDPGPGEVKIRQTAIGLNVAYAGVTGAYAEQRLVPADRVVKIPKGITDEIAASIMLKGMTAQYLLRRTYEVGGGTTLLFHAAAGGVGLIACQWAASLGGTVIGTVGSAGKALSARAHGCDYVINSRKEDFVAKVKDCTRSVGVDVVYDSVGKDTFPGSLNCLKSLGMWVSFGQSSGPVPEFNIALLSQKGSLFATRPSLAHYTATRKDLVATANDLFETVADGKVKVAVNQTYALADAAKAHRDLESRMTTGSTVLVP